MGCVTNFSTKTILMRANCSVDSDHVQKSKKAVDRSRSHCTTDVNSNSACVVPSLPIDQNCRVKTNLLYICLISYPTRAVMENLAADMIRESIEALKSSLLAELREIRAQMGDMECRMGSVEEHLVAAEVLEGDSKVGWIARDVCTCECANVRTIARTRVVSRSIYVRSQTFTEKSGYVSACCSCLSTNSSRVNHQLPVPAGAAVGELLLAR